MAGRGGGINWDDKELVARLTKMDKGIQAALIATGSKVAADGEAWMKSNAPWTDRTGNARNGLVGKFNAGKESGGTGSIGSYSVTFSHSVSYGVWLEIRHEGRFAIIIPAIEKFSLEWAGMVARVALS